jgi:hypothetical protein
MPNLEIGHWSFFGDSDLGISHFNRGNSGLSGHVSHRGARVRQKCFPTITSCA